MQDWRSNISSSHSKKLNRQLVRLFKVFHREGWLDGHNVSASRWRSTLSSRFSTSPKWQYHQWNAFARSFRSSERSGWSRGTNLNASLDKVILSSGSVISPNTTNLYCKERLCPPRICIAKDDQVDTIWGRHGNNQALHIIPTPLHFLCRIRRRPHLSWQMVRTSLSYCLGILR